MPLKVEPIDEISSGLKVKGDLGDLQIIEESSSENENSDCEPRALATIPNNLVHASITPVFGTVAVTNSENVQFGNNTYFNGPVTIKQVIQTNSGVDNATYQKTEDEDKPNGKSHSNNEPSLPKQKLKRWHKLSFTAALSVLLASVIGLAVFLTRESESQDPYKDTDGSEYTQVLELCSEKDQFYILAFISLILLVLLIAFYFILTNGIKNTTPADSVLKDNNNKNVSHTYNCFKLGFKGTDLLISPEHLRIVSRTDWLAQPVEEKLDQLRQPVPWVIITHTATESCFTQSTCVLRVRLIQTFHIESRGWSDIGYNFLVGGDGSAYFGRGWDYIGAHTKGYNKYSIAIAFIGTFNTEVPTKHQVEACRKLISLGVAEGKIAKDYALLAHRQLMSTLSPGDKVIEIIKTWPHFFNETDISSIIPKY